MKQMEGEVGHENNRGRCMPLRRCPKVNKWTLKKAHHLRYMPLILNQSSGFSSILVRQAHIMAPRTPIIYSGYLENKMGKGTVYNRQRKWVANPLHHPRKQERRQKQRLLRQRWAIEQVDEPNINQHNPCCQKHTT